MKLILVTFAATVIWMSTSHAAVLVGNIVCESNHDAYVECETGVTIRNPRIATERSNAACTMGISWSYQGSKIWVNHNCRAQFTYESLTTNPIPAPPVPAPQPTPCPTPRPPAYQVVDCRWNSQNWQPWYTPLGHFVGHSGFGFNDANVCVYTVQQSVNGAICNWTGNGFVSYDMETNREVVLASYPTIESCYDAVRFGSQH